MARKGQVVIGGADFEYVMWLLERRSDIGPFLRLMRILYGEVEDCVARYALRRLRKRDEAAADDERKKRHESTRPAGDDKIAALKVANQSRPWHGRWCLLTYDVPEKANTARRRLLRTVHAAGMGNLSGSAWISPYDWSDVVGEQAEECGLSRHMVWAQDARLNWHEGAAAAAQRIWGLDRIGQRYERLGSECDHIMGQNLVDAGAHRAAVRRMFKAFKAWTSLRTEDPMLPQELLPKNWPAKVAEDAINGARKRIGVELAR